jgi:two-component system, response regulator PdtaR
VSNVARTVLFAPKGDKVNDDACARASGVRIFKLMKALRVLVVEDDVLIAMLLTEMLAGMGHDVCATAATEAEAVIAAAHYRPDLMIVDAGLGRGSGVSAVEEICRAGPLAHVFISGDAERVRLRHPDAVVVRKPFRQAELVRAIEIALATAAVG